MRYVKWTLIALIVLIVGSFVHYTLPQHDIVRVVGTNTERTIIASNRAMFWSSGEPTRDVQFIQTVKTNGKTMEYRNEDTGWGWPPYFKFDTSSLYTEASDAVSNKANPEWYSITHYGWRNEVLSIFPNAIAIKPVSGADAKVVPWVNIIILTFFAIVLLLIWRMWVQFRERTIDPLVEDAGEAWDAVDDKADAFADSARSKARGVKGWFSNLRK
ncbi:DUF1523 family protein [Pacificibacter marinus]|uniref:DUF1523 domain-containing protein n=1 Tax=Pacificibacter marinus TaxID=658057 RepID=A0A1Y5S8Y4_9RHOB|nr:DUF1523 family protein [Pacificibacter marinus]SEK75455.1 Protein of unknown function [Pacificibacter marinus]SLN35062.1 hypothetical protein PAM7971_01535 [Pacificibacter marinus]